MTGSEEGISEPTAARSSTTVISFGSDLVHPRYKSGEKANRGDIVSSEPLVTDGDALEVLQSAEGALTKPAKLVEPLAEPARLLSIGADGNARSGSMLIELVAQFSAVVGLVAKHAYPWLYPADQSLRDREIVCFTTS